MHYSDCPVIPGNAHRVISASRADRSPKKEQGGQDQVSFWTASELGRSPQIGDTFAFDYYQSGTKRYAMLFDDPARTMDDDMVFDGPVTTEDPSRVPVDTMVPIQIGYKFRADLLHHASVLNSFDTLLLNNYQKPAKKHEKRI